MDDPRSPTFGSTTLFIVNHNHELMLIKVVPTRPDPIFPDDFHRDKLMRVYHHELLKVDSFRRKLRMLVGRMQEIDAMYFKNIENRGFLSMPLVKNCIYNMHICAKRMVQIRPRFRFVVTYKHLIVKRNSIENIYKVEPKITFVRNR